MATPIPERAVTILVSRLEIALKNGDLVLTIQQYGDVLSALFPEQFCDPVSTPESTSCLPGTDAKIVVLREREKARQKLWHRADTDAATQDRLSRTEQQYNPTMADGKYLWRITLPGGRSIEVWASTKSEARGFAKKVLGKPNLGRGKGNLVGVKIEKIEPPPNV